MNDHELAESLRSALEQRAGEVEPSTDAYARLAERVTSSSRPAPWWRHPRIRWIATVATGVAVLVVVLTTVIDDDRPDVVAVDDTATTATATAEPTPTVTATATALPAPDATALAAAEQAAIDFVRLHGRGIEASVASTEARADGTVEVTLAAVDESSQTVGVLTDEILTVVRLLPEPDGAWSAVSATSPDIAVDEPQVVQDGTGTSVTVTGWNPSVFVRPGETPTIERPPAPRLTQFGVEIHDRTGDTVAGIVVTAGSRIDTVVPLPFAVAGTGHVVIIGSDRTGVAWAMAVVPVELPEIDPTDGGTRCSASDMDPPAPQPGLGDAVAATRQAIIDAALACDIEALVALTDPDGFTASYGAGSPGEVWRTAEARGEEPLRWLVTVLGMPHRSDPDAVDGAPAATWPSAFGVDWADLDERDIDVLRPVHDQEQLDGFAAFGSYIGYRVGITAEGEWIFFVAGD